jgi:predicted kinase
MEVSVLIGIPGAGKSSFFRERFARSHVHVSKDLMRSMRNRNLRQMAIIRDALVGGKSVVVDNTNPRREDRAPLIAMAREFGADAIGYFFDAPLEECIRRNAHRHRRARVPNVAIYVAASRLEPPTYDEGFDRLYRVRLRDREFVVRAVPRSASPPSHARDQGR